VFAELAKPRIAVLVLLSVAASASVAAGGVPDLALLSNLLVGTLFVAASASALNQWLERRSDRLMERTAARPLPSGRVAPRAALAFASASLVVGVVLLSWQVNPFCAGWAFCTWLLYVGAYTPLKPVSPQNTVVGAVAGAMPVMIGWSAASAPFNLQAAALCAILYLWQLPHFMAIAWLYREQYARAGLRMLTVVDATGSRAGLLAVCAAGLLVPVSLLPAALRLAGLGYCLAALPLGAVHAWFAVRFARSLDSPTARALFWMSLVYLPSLWALLFAGLWTGL
jgi:protoheme IX farnesyltransferase